MKYLRYFVQHVNSSKKIKLKHSTSVNCLIETLWFWLWSNFLKISSMFFFAWFFLRFRFTAMKAIWNYYCIQCIKLIYGTGKKIMNIPSLSLLYVYHGMVRFATYNLCYLKIKKLWPQTEIPVDWVEAAMVHRIEDLFTSFIQYRRRKYKYNYSIPPPQVPVQPEVQVQSHVDARVE